jgi:hypothetical protein
MSDEWRVEVELEDEGHGLSLGDRLRSLDLDDEARKQLGERVIVTRDGSRMFLYTGSEETASQAERVVKELASEDGLEAMTRITRWHPDEEEWLDAESPMPESEAERARSIASTRPARSVRRRPQAATSGSCESIWIRSARPGSCPHGYPMRGSATIAAGGTC